MLEEERRKREEFEKQQQEKETQLRGKYIGIFGYSQKLNTETTLPNAN